MFSISRKSILALLAVMATGVQSELPANDMVSRPDPMLDFDEARRLTKELDDPERRLEDEGRVIVPPSARRERLDDIRKELSPEPQEQAVLQLRALEGYLDYDESDEIVYGPQRTQIKYGQYFLEADKLLMDARIQEVQAEGNVILRVGADEIRADSLRYNFADGEGVGYNVRGEKAPFYFRAPSKPGDQAHYRPQFQRVSQTEAIFRNTEMTGCDFKIPHYYMKAREVIFYESDRIFLRGVTLYIQGFPSFYLPFYSRSLDEASPWFWILGDGSRTGYRVRLGYGYSHETREPDFDNDDRTDMRSSGKAVIYADFMSELGYGAGFDYRYKFNFGRSKGYLKVYGLRANDRKVVGASPRADISDTFTEEDRGLVNWKHYAQLTEDMNLIINVDWMSDPDIYFDVLDEFESLTGYDRERVPERRARTALTYVREAYVLRLMAEVKDRVTSDRYYDNTLPGADNRDLDLDPYGRLDDENIDGVSGHRWGRATVRAPQFDASTRWLQWLDLPIYYQGELHMYNNLDDGFNRLKENDDSYVKGAEIYQALMWRWKMSERYVFLARVGAGVGVTDRDENYDFPFDSTKPFPQRLDTLVLTDNDGTFLAGLRERNLDKDVKDFYFYGDTNLKFNARITDALTAYIEHRYRETTDDFLGDFYASLGDTSFREDIYDYKLRENWVEVGLRYLLSRPRIMLSTSYGHNFDRDNAYSKELLSYWNNSIRWTNQRNTLALEGGFGLREVQLFDLSAPNNYVDRVYQVRAGARYNPVHGRWFIAATGSHQITERGLTEGSDSKLFTLFSDEDDRTFGIMTFGRELGPKYDTFLAVRWDSEVGGLREIAWTLQRDLHDALIVLGVSLEDDQRENQRTRRGEKEDRELQVQVSGQLKMPGEYVPLPGGRVKTIGQRYHEPAVAR